MAVRYFPGLRLRFICLKCQAKKWGTVFTQRSRWMARMECPHGLKPLGYRQPPDELFKKGLVVKDAPDPRIKATKEEQRRKWKKERAEIDDYLSRKHQFRPAKYQ